MKKDDNSSVQVAIRIRPFVNSEMGSAKCLRILPSNSSSSSNNNDNNNNDNNKLSNNNDRSMIQIGGSNGVTFTFDSILSASVTQRNVYDECVLPLTLKCLQGYNATVFAYGQTSSGKTFTIAGRTSTSSSSSSNFRINPNVSSSSSSFDDELEGIIPRALRDLFQRLNDLKSNLTQSNDRNHSTIFEFEVRLQYLEIYGEDVRDLLASNGKESSNLKIRDAYKDGDEPEVVGASELTVESADEALMLMERGSFRRVTGATNMNASSSRSHAIMTVIVEQMTTLSNDEIDSTTDNVPTQHTQAHESLDVQVKRSKFHFVDLAGSERQKRTGATGDRLKEGIDINKGLLALGNVISALGDPKKQGKIFVPYRDSKLTRLLKGSLGGNHKTLMIACVSPSANNMAETLCCLRYANRAKNIKNNAVINVDAGSKKLVELREYLQVLSKELIRVNAAPENSVKVCLPMNLLESLAKGNDVVDVANLQSSNETSSPRTFPELDQENGNSDCVELSRLKSLYQTSEDQVKWISEEVVKVGAEEYERMTSRESIGREDDGTKPSTLDQVMKYEKELLFDPRKLELEQVRSRHPHVTNHIASNDDDLNEDNDESDNDEEANLVDIDQLISDESRSIFDEDLWNNNSNSNDSYNGTMEGNEKEIVFLQRQKTMDAHIVDLSRSIVAKEELLKQLNLMQDKYEKMRLFYEEKLAQMEHTVNERERERNDLMRELEILEKSKDNNSVGRIDEMRKELKEKENKIFQLRSRHAEVLSLTKISSRNEKHIDELKSELVSMKKQRVDLQKQISQERKLHMNEMKEVKRQAMKLDREAAKLRQESNLKSQQIENVQRLAKSRLEEVGRVRSKYREVEKKLRMHTLKQGVMARAGVDNVLTGRQVGSEQRTNKNTPNTVKLRQFFDEKITEVGKIEESAEKLALEWEEHLQLQLEKDELVKRTESENICYDDDIESLELQIKFKQDRIRKLSSHLRKPILASRGGDVSKIDLLLNSKELGSINSGIPALYSTQAMVKVLFGMIVKERRRVATLVRTASKLDEKLIQLDQERGSMEAALQAQLAEQKHTQSTMANEQHNLILSLMSLVKDDSNETDITSIDSSSSQLVVTFAQQRIQALEDEVQALRDECVSLKSIHDRYHEMVSSFHAEKKETEILRNEVAHLYDVLRQVRDKIPSSPESKSRTTSRSNSPLLGLDIITTSKNFKSKENHSNKQDVRNLIQNTLKRPLTAGSREGLYFSDSEDDTESGEEIPEWADDIMADLQVIAAGGVPESLRDCNPAENVFARLADPHNYTGTQKHTRRIDRPNTGEIPNEANQLDNVKVTTSIVSLNPQFDSNDNDTDDIEVAGLQKPTTKSSKARRSVYQRLHSPSSFTGTHKNAVQEDKQSIVRIQGHSKALENEMFSEISSSSSNQITATKHRSYSSATSKDEFEESAASNKVQQQKSTGKITSYIQQNVFERLQHTVTASFAGKKDVNSPEE